MENSQEIVGNFSEFSQDSIVNLSQNSNSGDDFMVTKQQENFIETSLKINEKNKKKLRNNDEDDLSDLTEFSMNKSKKKTRTAIIDENLYDLTEPINGNHVNDNNSDPETLPKKLPKNKKKLRIESEDEYQDLSISNFPAKNSNKIIDENDDDLHDLTEPPKPKKLSKEQEKNQKKVRKFSENSLIFIYF